MERRKMRNYYEVDLRCMRWADKKEYLNGLIYSFWDNTWRQRKRKFKMDLNNDYGVSRDVNEKEYLNGFK